MDTVLVVAQKENIFEIGGLHGHAVLVIVVVARQFLVRADVPRLGIPPPRRAIVGGLARRLLGA
jgi:hypothetical protein